MPDHTRRRQGSPTPQTLARRNRPLLAERLGWPQGALADCERIDRERPGWTAWYHAENTIRGFERPAEFVADREEDGVRLSAADADKLLAEIDSDPPVHRWVLPIGEHCMCRRCNIL